MTTATAAAPLTDAQEALRAYKRTPVALTGWLRRQTRTLAANWVKAGNVEDLELLVQRRDAIDQAIGEAIAGYRAQGHSWTEIGRALGVTKQSAQGRYGAATVTPAVAAVLDHPADIDDTE